MSTNYICPSCKNEFIIKKSKFFCDNNNCNQFGYVDYLANKKPILIDYDNSLFSKSSLIKSNASSPLKRSVLSGHLLKTVKKLLNGSNIKTKENFEIELEKFRNIVGKDVKGFRAPTFSLDASTSWAIDCLKKFGYSYDSSMVPVKTKMYGLSKAEKYPYKISSSSLEKHDSKSEIWEFPLMKTKILGKNIPAGGGFYLRTLPTRIIQNSINQYNKKNKPAIMYIHSWELTPEHMPKIELPIKEKFITYHNIHKALPRMDELVKKFEFTLALLKRRNV